MLLHIKIYMSLNTLPPDTHGDVSAFGLKVIQLKNTTLLGF
jgi:hypothetical protein